MVVMINADKSFSLAPLFLLLCLSLFSSFFLPTLFPPVLFFCFFSLFIFSVFPWFTFLPSHREELAEVCCNNAGFDDNEPFPKITVRKSRNLKRPTEGKTRQKKNPISPKFCRPLHLRLQSISLSSPSSSLPSIFCSLAFAYFLYRSLSHLYHLCYFVFFLVISKMATEAPRSGLSPSSTSPRWPPTPPQKSVEAASAEASSVSLQGTLECQAKGTERSIPNGDRSTHVSVIASNSLFLTFVAEFLAPASL